MTERRIDAVDNGRVGPRRWTQFALIALLGSGFLALYFVQATNYLLFHSLAELFSIVIAAGVFLVAWNARSRMDSSFLLIVGVAYAFVALLDSFHMLAYAGMGVFPGYGSNLATQFWIAARYLEALSLVTGTAFIGHNMLTARVTFSRGSRDTLVVLLAYASITATLILTIFSGLFPVAYEDGVGLTRFKILSEYVIIGLLGIGLEQLYRHRTTFEPRVFRTLALALVLTMGAEFAFTLYVSVYGLSNMIGHLLKIASFYLIYIAVIQTGISTPQNLLFRQLTEERNALTEREAELERQNERLEKFASIVSHDLRNPLSVAQGRVQLAREESDSEHLAAAERAHTRMNELIADLLVLARTEDSITDVEPIALREQIQACWQSVETEAATIQIEIDPDAVIQADAGRLSQLFENLFRNAIEHGGQEVTITVGALDESGFFVEDDGPGIPEAERTKVFEYGYSTTPGGTGFGLAIVKHVVEAHGWEIQLTDGSAGGARFEITGVDTA